MYFNLGLCISIILWFPLIIGPIGYSVCKVNVRPKFYYCFDLFYVYDITKA